MARIVLAEDHDDIRPLLVRILQRSGHDVAAFVSCDEALAEVLARGADLVLLDISTPGDRDGIDVTRELRAHPATASTPVLLLSARAQERDVQVGLAAGADAYLPKPFSPGEVKDVVGRLLAGS